jgi:hypothetical protein
MYFRLLLKQQHAVNSLTSYPDRFPAGKSAVVRTNNSCRLWPGQQQYCVPTGGSAKKLVPAADHPHCLCDPLSHFFKWQPGLCSGGEVGPGVKLTTPACSVKVKNKWSYASNPTIVYMVCSGRTLLYMTFLSFPPTLTPPKNVSLPVLA